MSRAIFCFTLLVVLTLPAQAWNAVGHRIVAEIVWRQLTAEQRRSASELLQHHPHYTELLTANVPRGVDTNEWAFLMAAVWPDLVRPNRAGRVEAIAKYDVYPHAIGYPFMKPMETNHALIEKFYIAKPNAEMVLSNVFATLKDPNASAPDRAVSLCWVLHLCADLHQPLHAANLVTKERPNGDQLGGHHFVQEQGRELSMHTFWDSLPGVDGSYAYISKQAKAIAGDRNLKEKTARELADDKTIASWVQESFQIAVHFAYQDGKLKFVEESDLKSGKVRRSDVPKLSSAYTSEAHEIARQRLFLAAQREIDDFRQVW